MKIENFILLLKHLEFSEEKGLHTKLFNNAVLQVNVNKKEIIYPEGLIINNKTTCNFSAGENFVVFECVHRLLEKDYKPEHIELEPTWKVGRGGSGGRADILVRNNDAMRNSLLIIECKTAGEEFIQEKRKMENNGGQLFSYLQQDKNADYLCLYCSEFNDFKVEYQSAIVKIIDRKEDEEAFKNGDENIKLFRNANNNKELFEVWKDTFNLYFHYNGIFENDVNAYKIELKPLKKKNLRPLSEATNTFNTFMEILRHNNISDNANAFNRILSLFLCKIVDEEKGDDEILDFQVKEGEDAEAIQDRLQRLYAQGMKEHLREEIVYFEDDVIQKIIALYPKQTKMDKIANIFKQIKYYTQNEFALKEVHNKDLFIQNARVLNEVIKLLQNFQFRYNKKQQILGDFFELLLNHGVKQSEGQFFTPVPIVRFILFSIGLDKIIQQKLANNQKDFLPRILDYACGAGHFLTESINELQLEIEKNDGKQITNKDALKNLRKYKADTAWAQQYIFGIEKDYRLARTSRIACFLNGDGDANIIYGDGLENHDKIDTDNLFDVIVSNPPYSIKSFKNYLQVGSEQYKIFSALTAKSSEIETLFVERTAQLLRPGGIAAIILPTSILRGKGVYAKTREILLKHFEIKAIAELDDGTFGATGMTTIVLFLKGRSDDFRKDRWYIAKDLFGGIKRKGNFEHIKSANLFKKYVSHLGFEEQDYQSLFNNSASSAMKKSDLWREYEKMFQKTASNQSQFYHQILEAEKWKFYFFMLTLDDNHLPQTVVVVNSGDGNIANIFRGYKFSNRKGGQGIQMFDSTKLYDENDCDNPKKANSYILKNLWGKLQAGEIDEEMMPNINVSSLTNMLNFSTADLDLEINLNPQKKIQIKTKWDLVKLGEIVSTQYGYTATATESGDIRYLRITDITEEGRLKDSGKKYISPSNSIKNEFLLQKGDIVIARSGSVGRMFLYKNIDEKLVFASYLVRLKTTKKVLPEYIFAYHQTEYYWEQVDSLKTKLAQPNLNANQMGKIEIPLPTLTVQQRIVDECESLNKKAEKARQIIVTNKQKIEQKMQEVMNAGDEMQKLGEFVPIIESGKRPKGGVGNILSGALSLGGEHIHAENGKIDISTPKYVPINFYDNNKRGILQKNDILLCKDGALTGKIALLRNELTNKKAMVNEHVFILRCDSLVTQQYVFYFLYSNNGQKLLKQNITGSAQGGLNHTNLKNIKIPIPPLKAQKNLVAELEKSDAKIAEAQAKVDAIPILKNAILKKHLKIV